MIELLTVKIADAEEFFFGKCTERLKVAGL